ncbi:protein polyglycylase TTLL10 isoform X2 [Engraulis encrasicolus]|uniref:protein polyglycylase TTLL10 isoform X2 n=1 Tax=Engraulis encrasicolus TaxID=184585 RepID=UPI002FD70412
MSLENHRAAVGSDSHTDTLPRQEEANGDHTGRDNLPPSPSPSPPARDTSIPIPLPPPPAHPKSPQQQQAKSESDGEEDDEGEEEEISGLGDNQAGEEAPCSGAAGKQQDVSDLERNLGGDDSETPCEDDSGTPEELEQQGSRTSRSSDRESGWRSLVPQEPGPFYFIGGTNGAPILTAYCESKGWQRIYDKSREDYKLKWCETRSMATYYNFKEGEQLVYQIPNNKVLTSKIGLLNSLREYDRVSNKVNQGRGLRMLKMDEFFPDTYRMDVKDEREAFFNTQERACERAISSGSSSSSSSPSVWICKPTYLNQGRGIFLLRSLEDMVAFRLRLQRSADKQSGKLPFRLPQARIVQKYVQNPLLLNGRKFDVRSYLLIASTCPYMVFFRHGYVRLTCDLYDPDTDNLSAHLTNQYMQKKNPLYRVLKEDTVWSIQRFNDYINDNFKDRGLPKDWVQGVFTRRMQQIMLQCFMAVKAKLVRKLGFFDLIGCDFLIDEDFKVWLLEMNCNPALHTNCEVLKEVVPCVVTETLDLALEIFEKVRCSCKAPKLLPLASQKDFVILYREDDVPISSRRNKATLPPQLQLKLQPTKAPSNTTTTTTTAQQPRNTGAGAGAKPQRAAAMSVRTNTLPGQRAARSASSSDTFAKPSDSASSSTSLSSSTATSQAAKPSPSASRRPSTTSVAQVSPRQQAAPVSALPRVSVRPRKQAPMRVLLRLNKCTWQQHPPAPAHRQKNHHHHHIASQSMPTMSDPMQVPKRCSTPYPKEMSRMRRMRAQDHKALGLRVALLQPSQAIWTDVEEMEKTLQQYKIRLGIQQEERAEET